MKQTWFSYFYFTHLFLIHNLKKNPCSRESTIEKEINIFIDWKISNNVCKITSGKELKNGAEFQNGGGLFVSGSLSILEDDVDERKRTNFKFTTGSLDLGKWGTYEIPPAGKG